MKIQPRIYIASHFEKWNILKKWTIIKEGREIAKSPKKITFNLQRAIYRGGGREGVKKLASAEKTRIPILSWMKIWQQKKIQHIYSPILNKWKMERFEKMEHLSKEEKLQNLKKITLHLQRAIGGGSAEKNCPTSNSQLKKTSNSLFWVVKNRSSNILPHDANLVRE